MRFRQHESLLLSCKLLASAVLASGLMGCAATGPAAAEQDSPAPEQAAPIAAPQPPPAAAKKAPALTPEEIERKRQMALLRKKLQVSKLADESLRLGIASDTLFEYGGASPRPGARETFLQIAELLKTCDRIAVHVIGHTDNFGEPSTNLWLSQVRAASVAFYLEQNGVPKDRIRYEGRGDQEPLESNLTEEGQRINRRVDIVLRPMWPGREQEAFRPPPPLGRN